MPTQLDELYSKLISTKIFEMMPECENCKMECGGSRRERWLLKEEVERLKNNFPEIIDVDGVPFFEGGICPNLKDGKCSIYAIRPLECRISPVKLIEDRGELYWMLTKACRLLQSDDDIKVNQIKKKANIYIDKIETFFPKYVWEELKSACKAINTFDPYTDGKDCIVLRKVRGN